MFSLQLPQLDPVEDMNNANFTICNLTPNTNYSIQIAIMPVVYRQLVGNLSDWTTVHTRTNQSGKKTAHLPGCVPDVSIDRYALN